MSVLEIILAIIGGLVVIGALFLVGLFAVIGVQTCLDDVKDERAWYGQQDAYRREQAAMRQLEYINRVSNEAMIGSIVRHLPADHPMRSIGSGVYHYPYGSRRYE
jgi:hypothetical protein